MTSDVNPPGPPPLRQAQVAHTEERIIAAAAELFLTEGYPATTLAREPVRISIYLPPLASSPMPV